MRRVVAFALVLAASVYHAIPAPMVRGTLTRSDVCGGCHKDIYIMWQSSVHARSMEDSIFQQAYRAAGGIEGGGRECLSCHAPAIDINGDRKLDMKVTWEGVSCDICHSLVAVDPTQGTPKMTLDPGPVKRGPIQNAASMAHEVAYSELHVQSLVCAGCHEFRNKEGTPIITTYSEWKSGYATKEGRTCQSCHMARIRADVVDPKIKRVSDTSVNLHEMPGGHSLDQLHRALDMSLQPARDGDHVLLTVAIKNKGAGHAVPTGMPGRRVILEVRASTSQNRTFQERRVYTRSFKDAKGALITRDGDYFAKGVALVSDTRIGPGERRQESFRFEAPASAAVYFNVSLYYEHAPTGGPEDRTWIVFQDESRTLLPAGSGSNGK